MTIGNPPITVTLFNIKLYRRLTNYYGNRRDTSYPFLLWGYFDGMECSKIKNLNKFYFAKEDTHIQEYEIHQLCLYSPHNSTISNLFEKDPTLPPLLVLSELKVNEEVILENVKNNHGNGNGYPLGFLKQLIADRIDTYQGSTETQKSPVLFQIYSMLGYGDFLIVFRSFCYQQVINIINSLRSEPYNLKNKKKKVQLLRSTYSITGFERSSINQIDRSKKFDVSLRISLKTPVNLAFIEEKISNDILSHSEGNKIPLEPKTVFGKYDLDVLLQEMPLHTYAQMFNDKNRLLHPLSNFSKKYISFTNTRWLLNIMASPENRTTPPKNVYGILETDSIYSKLPPHVQGALRQLTRQYHQITRNEASETPLLYELKTIIEVFLEIVKNNIENKHEVNEETLDLFRIGIRMISEFMQSRVQASRMLFEMPVYNIHFIDSSTKVSMLYMTFVRQFEEIINQFEKKTHNIENRLKFFTIMEYLKKIKSLMLFPMSENKQLIPISLSRVFFADLPYNILMLAHETSHYIRPSNQENLNKAFCDVICMIIAKIITVNFILGGTTQAIYSDIEVKDVSTKLIMERIAGFINEKVVEKIEISSTFLEFQVILSDIIEEVFSFYDNDVKEKYDLLDQELNLYTNEFNPRSSENTRADIRRILDLLIERIKNGDDTSDLENLWTSFLNKIEKDEDSDFEKEKYKILWRDLVGTAKTRKNKLSSDWIDLVEKDLFSHIDTFFETVISQDDPSLIKYSAACRINEEFNENSRFIVKHILQEMNKESVQNKIRGMAHYSSILFSEACADYFMCKLLNLNNKQYGWLIKRFKKNIGLDPSLANETELELRSFVMRKSIFNLTSTPPVSIRDIWEGMFCQLIVDYLDTYCLTDWENYLEPEVANKFDELREFLNISIYTKNDPASIRLIEKYWGFGINLFSEKKNHAGPN